jgi:tol-pal system protein YbgF
VVNLRTTILAEMDADRAQRDSLIVEIRQLRAVLLDSLNVQQRRGISGRVDLQRQIEDLNVALAQLIELTGETQRQLSLLRESGSGGSHSGPVGGQDAAGGGEVGALAANPTGGDGAGQGQQLYEAALRQFRRESYATARAGFEEFLGRFPNHELAPDAQYFMAETFANSEDPEAALAEYARILELYPNSRRAPTALYKSGVIELQRGNVDDARTFFTRVVQGYPNSDEVELARRELARLGG